MIAEEGNGREAIDLAEEWVFEDQVFQAIWPMSNITPLGEFGRRHNLQSLRPFPVVSAE